MHTRIARIVRVAGNALEFYIRSKNRPDEYEPGVAHVDVKEHRAFEEKNLDQRHKAFHQTFRMAQKEMYRGRLDKG